jgi:hypothetical protein
MLDYVKVSGLNGLKLRLCVVHTDGLSVEVTVWEDIVEIVLSQWEDDGEERVIAEDCVTVPDAHLRVYGDDLLDFFADDHLVKFRRLTVHTNRGRVAVKIRNEEIWQWELDASPHDSNPHLSPGGQE